MSRQFNNADAYKKYIAILKKHDSFPSDIDIINWTKMHISDHKKKVDYALTEAKNNNCATLGPEVL